MASPQMNTRARSHAGGTPAAFGQVGEVLPELPTLPLMGLMSVIPEDIQLFLGVCAKT